jgi:tRNA pseudouridine38/39 synthase
LRLLDVETCTRKPQYNMASEIPLVLYDCGFEDLRWRMDPHTYQRVLDCLFAQWEDKALRFGSTRN